jgi:hypothetical protein
MSFQNERKILFFAEEKLKQKQKINEGTTFAYEAQMSDDEGYDIMAKSKNWKKYDQKLYKKTVIL